MKNNIVQKLINDFSFKQIDKVVSYEMEPMKSLLGFKSKVDANKKKILISQTFKDKNTSDTIYKMLLFNGVPKDDIIYSNGPDPETKSSRAFYLWLFTEILHT